MHDITYTHGIPGILGAVAGRNYIIKIQLVNELKVLVEAVDYAEFVAVVSKRLIFLFGNQLCCHSLRGYVQVLFCRITNTALSKGNYLK